jgi:hypothetical protein
MIQTKNKTVFLSLTRLTNKSFLYTSTHCARPSETFRTSYPVFSIVVFRETTSTEHTISVLVHFIRPIIIEKEHQGLCSELMGVSNGDGSLQTLSSVFLRDQEEHSTQADWFWI